MPNLWHFMSCMTEIREPTSVRRWDFFNIRPQSWREIYELPYKCTRATRLQALHFRIVNRYIPTRKYLCTRGVVGSPLCLKCFDVDDLEHFFVGCADVKELWNRLISKLKQIFRLPNNFGNYQTLVLGCPAAPPVVNLIVLLTKQYIVNCKLSYNDTVRVPNFAGLLSVVQTCARFRSCGIDSDSACIFWSWFRFWFQRRKSQAESILILIPAETKTLIPIPVSQTRNRFHFWFHLQCIIVISI